MEGLLKYNYADADATGVAHDNIDAELANNRQEKLEKLIHQSKEEGSIRALPYLQTAEGQQTMLDMAMGSAFPGAAIGRVAKGAVTGGHLGREGLKKYYQRLIHGGKYKRFDDEMLSQKKYDNKVSASRLAREKAFDKFGLPHQRANPVKPEESLPLMDSVSEILHALRFRKN